MKTSREPRPIASRKLVKPRPVPNPWKNWRAWVSIGVGIAGASLLFTNPEMRTLQPEGWVLDVSAGTLFACGLAGVVYAGLKLVEWVRA